MPKRRDYASMVKEAESAVVGMTDPELRKAAFERVLGDLLGNAEPVAGERRSPIAAKRLTARTSKTIAKRGPQAYISELVDDGFFDSPKTLGEVGAELANRGHHIVRTSLSGPLQKLCQLRNLRRQKVKKEGKKQNFSYSKW